MTPEEQKELYKQAIKEAADEWLQKQYATFSTAGALVSRNTYYTGATEGANANASQSLSNWGDYLEVNRAYNCVRTINIINNKRTKLGI